MSDLVESEWDSGGVDRPTCGAPDDYAEARAFVRDDVVEIEIANFPSDQPDVIACGDERVCSVDLFVVRMPLPLRAGEYREIESMSSRSCESCDGAPCETSVPLSGVEIYAVSDTCIVGTPLGLESGGPTHRFVAEVCDSGGSR